MAKDGTWRPRYADGDKVTLFADGTAVAGATLKQGRVAALAEMAPAPVAAMASRHFGGKIASFKIYREALAPDTVQAMAAAPPDFAVPTYEEASRRWPVQTNAQAGYSVPQDPSSLPRGKGGFSKPVAKPLVANELKTELAGANPWTLKGGWKLAAAPSVKASGEEISKAGFAATDWYAATVPGTVLTTLIDRGVYPDPDYGLNNLAIPESLAHQNYWYRAEFQACRQRCGDGGSR